MKTKISTLLGSALLVTGFASTIIAAPAQAAPPARGGSGGGGSTTPTVQCNINNVKLGNVLATACAGPLAGNDTGSGAPLETKLEAGLFQGYTGDWNLVGKSDGESGAFGVKAQNGNDTGTWGFSKALNTNTFVVSLKTSTAHSAYLFANYDWSKGLTGVFNTIGVAANGSGTAGKDLSHLSVFALNVVQPAPEKKIPEPATMMGLGVVASSMLIRRRKSN